MDGVRVSIGLLRVACIFLCVDFDLEFMVIYSSSFVYVKERERFGDFVFLFLGELDPLPGRQGLLCAQKASAGLFHGGPRRGAVCT